MEHDHRAASAIPRRIFIARRRPGACSPPSTSTPATSPGRCSWAFPTCLPEGKKDTGRPSNGGPIVTASGVTFIGGTDDQRFRAFDSKTGKELWTTKLDYSAHATPITYQGKDGRQYVAVVATGGSYLASPAGGDSLMVFALPK